MRLLVFASLLVFGCNKSREAPAPVRAEIDPVSEADAKAFAEKFAVAAKSCDEAKLAPMIETQAMAAKFLGQTTLPNAPEAARMLAKSTLGARILCAWMKGVGEYKLLRVRMVGTEPRPILRRLITDPRNGFTIVGYDELQLGTTRSDHQVRIVDAFSYVQGQWITQLLGGNVDAMAKSLDYLGDLPLMAETVRKARDLQRAGSNKEALEIIDRLPTTVRQYRGVQMMRVRAAAGVSPEAYKQALDELAKVFPNDPSIAMVETDGAFRREDYAAALTWIDMIDSAIGGDAFQAANRALAYLKLNQLDKAAEQADKATTMDPTLGRAWEVKLEVVVAQKKWTEALAVMTELETKHGVHFEEDKLRVSPATAELVATPEFKAWLAKRGK
jgi:tetratricopeptide (TPR) repeat protein